MDLNLLLHRHQVSVMRAAAAAGPEARFAHKALAVGYAERIATIRTAANALAPLMVLGR